MEAEPGTDRVLTIPNGLSALRLSCVPLFVWLMFGADDLAAAGVLLAVLGVTDWVDGFIARRFDQVSTLGKILDPTADRLLLGVGIVSIMVAGAAPAWVAWAAVVREVLVAGAALALAALGARRIDVTWVGKAGTFGLMVAFPSFLMAHAGVPAATAFRVVAWVAAVPGLVLAYWAAITYIPLARAALQEGRVGSGA